MSQQTRRSQKREAIYALLCSVDCHPSAQWVYERMREQYPQLSLGTVYRNLAEFRAQGKLRTVAVVQGQERFDANTADHVHLICTQCGAVEDLKSKAMDMAVRRCAALCPNPVSGAQLTFTGLCSACASMPSTASPQGEVPN